MENLLEKLNNLGFTVANTFSSILRYLTETQVLGYPLIDVIIGSSIAVTLALIIVNFFRE